MPVDPLYEDTLPIRTSAIKKLEVIAGIDRGCSLTKIVFLPKGVSLDDAEFVPLRCLTVLNANFEDALLTLKSAAQLPTSGKLHCTGVGGDVYREKIKEIVGLDTAIIPEHFTLAPGAFLTLTNTKAKEIFHPTAPHKSWQVDNEKVKEIFGSMNVPLDMPTVTDDEPLFPAVVLYIGSGSGFFPTDEQGKSKFTMSGFFGKTFIALASLLLGTTNYNEIMDLAAAGNRMNVSQSLGDLTENQGVSSFGPLPLDILAFPFGKAALDTFDRSKVSRADLAASLVAYFAMGIYNEMTMVYMLTKARRFYVAGNFARGEMIRSQILEANSRFPPHLDIRFIRTGHTGAIGAMMLSENECSSTWAKSE